MAEELRERDRRDRTRATSPLEPAPDAVILDSTALSEEEVMKRVEALVAAKLESSNNRTRHPRSSGGAAGTLLFAGSIGTASNSRFLCGFAASE